MISGVVMLIPREFYSRVSIGQSRDSIETRFGPRAADYMIRRPAAENCLSNSTEVASMKKAADDSSRRRMHWLEACTGSGTRPYRVPSEVGITLTGSGVVGRKWSANRGNLGSRGDGRSRSKTTGSRRRVSIIQGRASCWHVLTATKCGPNTTVGEISGWEQVDYSGHIPTSWPISYRGSHRLCLLVCDW